MFFLLLKGLLPLIVSKASGMRVNVCTNELSREEIKSIRIILRPWQPSKAWKLSTDKPRLGKCVQLYNWALYGINNDGNGIESQQGKEHPNTIHTFLGYAIVLQHQGRYQHALSLYEEVIAQRTANLGPIHPDTITAMHNQGDILRCLGQLERAKSIFSKVLDARKQHIGPEHPDTLRTYDGLTNVYRDLERWEESDKLYAKALNGREDKLGFNHADTIATVHHIATS